MVNKVNTDILTASLENPIVLAYGRHVVAGNIMLRHEADDGRVVVFLALGEGEWDGVEEIYVNGAPIDITSVAGFHFHRGALGELSHNATLDPEGTGTPFPFLTAGDQKADALTPPGVQGLTFSRTAYLALNIPFDVYAPGPDLDVRGVYRTRRVRIFDSAGVEVNYRYSENPVWQIADLLTRVRGIADSRLDWPSFASAAGYCDQEIFINDKSVPRFISHIAFTEETDFDSALISLLATCRGYLMDLGGAIQLRIDQPRTPIFDFHMNNILEDSFQALYRDVRETPNRAELLFRDTDNNFASMTKQWNHELQQSRTGRVLATKIQLGNTSQQQAERIGNYLLTVSIDNNLFCRFRSTCSSLAVLPGDVVRVLHDSAPWSQGTTGDARFLEFEVTEAVDYPDDTREFLCRVYNAEAYPDTAGPTQNLIATNTHRRPLPPPKPPAWGLSANLAGDLKLRFAIPRNADYRTGDLTLLGDEELSRTVTTLAVSLDEEDGALSVNNSSGFLVGDLINIGSEVMLLAGPGLKGFQPISTDWQIGRSQRGTENGSAVPGDQIYRLSERILHFVLPPGYSLMHPTRSLIDGKYYQIIFRPGRIRILHGILQFTGLGGRSESVFAGYSVQGVTEPNVFGTLPGLRVATGGRLILQVPGPLATGADLVQPVYLPAEVSVGLIYASVEKASTGQSILFQMLLDGQPFGPVGNIPSGVEGDPSSSGVILSGAEIGGVGGRAISVNLLQVGSLLPGEDLSINVTL